MRALHILLCLVLTELCGSCFYTLETRKLLSALHFYNKIPETITYKEKGVILAYSSRGLEIRGSCFSLGLWQGRHIMVEKSKTAHIGTRKQRGREQGPRACPW
jgi:hypothetical protein